MEAQPPVGPEALLSAVGRASSDPSGTDTFSRYVWQAKQAVRLWLTCLTDTGPSFVLCERVEDVVLVYADFLRMIQLKTRDKGSWSVSDMCSSGLDSLVRSFKALTAIGRADVATFELWLEGPMSDKPETVRFVQDPTTAPQSIRNKILAIGIDEVDLDRFLGGLRIIPNQPPRGHVDAIAMWEIGAFWPARSRHEVAEIYMKLLTVVEAAQGATRIPEAIARHLAGKLDLGEPVSRAGDNSKQPLDMDQYHPQVLTKAVLRLLTPPRPGESIDHLTKRIQMGQAASLLELKMAASGAKVKTIKRAQAMRAQMEIDRQELLASRADAEQQLEQLADRVLLVAEATASDVDREASVNPAAASGPAESIANRLLSQPANLASLDREGLFEKDGLKVYGYLGQLSDQCLYEWRG
jgi:hypothetical protein